VLDIGCGAMSPLRFFHFKHSTGMDIFKPAIEKAKQHGTHNEYYEMNTAQLAKHFKPKSFEACTAIDLIEHLSRADGIALMNTMESIASKKVIIFTPNGFLNQEEYDNNPHQVHKSGWTVNDFTKRGYKVYGFFGHKALRKEGYSLVHKPRILWAGISELTQLYTYHNAQYASALLAVKVL